MKELIIKKLIIKKLSLRNFKAIKTLDLEPGGKNLNVFGDNGLGKTTIYDAFLWLLIDKDSLGRKDFAVKETDKSGKEILGLDHSVEAIFLMSGEEFKLGKILHEKWTKKRGAAKAEFTGNTTDYFVNDVPSKKSEFDDKIKEMFSETRIELLTNPRFFNEQLHWKERRDLLLEVAGDISDEEVIKSNPRFEKLNLILNGKTISEYLKIISARRKNVNEELEKIPVRIDESAKSAESVNISDVENARKELEEIEESIIELEKKIKNIRNEDSSESERSLRILESKKAKFETEYEENKRKASRNSIEQKETQYMELVDLRQKSACLTIDIEKLESRGKRVEKDIAGSREEYKKISNEIFEFSQEEICPACGQKLPAEKIKNAREQAFQLWKENKNGKLAANVEIGKALIAEFEKIRKDIEIKKSSLKECNIKLEKKEVLYSSATDKLEKILKNIGSIEDDREYRKILDEIDVYQKAITELKKNSSGILSELNSKLSEKKREKNEKEKIIASESLIAISEKRIEELKEREKQLATEFEKLEEELNICEKFIVARVGLLEEKINSKFDIARFKLFQEQINGGITECCEVMFNGATYWNMNNAARMNVGLDIISTLSGYYKLQAPIFIDNRESVVRLQNIDAQIISLIVSGKDKKLRIEEAKENE